MQLAYYKCFKTTTTIDIIKLFYVKYIFFLAIKIGNFSNIKCLRLSQYFIYDDNIMVIIIYVSTIPS